MKTPTFVSAALLLMLLVSGISSRREGSKRKNEHSGESSEEEHIIPTVSSQTSISVEVNNAGANPPVQTYSTTVAFRGILLGGLRRLQESNVGFNFTYTEDPNYGPYLQSVNGVAGNFENHTYWELLVKKNRYTVKPDVGIGCYIPGENDQIILKFSTY